MSSYKQLDGQAVTNAGFGFQCKSVRAIIESRGFPHYEENCIPCMTLRHT